MASADLARENATARLWQGIAPADPARTLKALERLRAMFLAHATKGAVYLDDPELLDAYRAFFFPQTFAKARSVLDELGGRPFTRVLDLGSAMGGAAFAAWSLDPGARIELLDFSDAALADARKISGALSVRCTTRKHRLDEPLPKAAERYDLVIAANALSELPFEARVERCKDVFANALAPGGAFVVIEPADRVHARDLQTLRDALIPLGHVPIAPCPHAAPCPASVRPRDFCHQARKLAVPAWHLDLQRAVGISDERLRFSYLVYGDPSHAHQPDLVRIISHPIKDKGRLRFLGCAASGLVELQRQDKHKSEANAAFDTLGRGSLLSMSNVEARMRIEKETPIAVVAAADSVTDEE